MNKLKYIWEKALDLSDKIYNPTSINNQLVLVVYIALLCLVGVVAVTAVAL